jgi:hypothetical protein
MMFSTALALNRRSGSILYVFSSGVTGRRGRSWGGRVFFFFGGGDTVVSRCMEKAWTMRSEDGVLFEGNARELEPKKGQEAVCWGDGR